MSTITPKPYTVCDFCGKVIDDEISRNQGTLMLQHNYDKYELCEVCNNAVKKAIRNVKDSRLAEEAI